MIRATFVNNYMSFHGILGRNSELAVYFRGWTSRLMWPRLINTVTRQPPGRIGKPLRMCPGGECAECVIKKCLTSALELSIHPFGTLLKSNALTFQSASI